MSLVGVLRKGVGVLNRVTRKGGLQAVVMYAHPTVADGFGPTHAAPVPLHAFVDFRSVQVRTKEGTEVTTRSVLELVDVNEVVAATGGAGISNDGIFTLPDGDTGPILDIGGFIDAGTGHPVATTVMLG